MIEQVETVIIGGGQAGLALSYYLTRQGRTHLVLEQGRMGEVWRSGRWDSFTLNTPNWMIQLPGFPYQGSDPDGFLPREGIVAYLEQYAASFHAPIRCGVRVTAVRQQPGGNGHLVEAEQITLNARNVVLATGAYPPRAVGELHDASAARTPHWWLTRLGFFDRTLDQLPAPSATFECAPHVSGNHGDDVNLRTFARQGMILLGRVQAAQGKQIILAPDLEENLARADAFERQITHPRIAQRDSNLWQSSLNMCLFEGKEPMYSYQGGRYDQYRRWSGDHPDLFGSRPLDSFLVWRSHAARQLSSQARCPHQDQ